MGKPIKATPRWWFGGVRGHEGSCGWFCYVEKDLGGARSTRINVRVDGYAPTLKVAEQRARAAVPVVEEAAMKLLAILEADGAGKMGELV